MSENASILPSLARKNKMSSLFPASKLFQSISSKGFTDSDTMRSPTSILDSKPFFVRNHPFFAERKCRMPCWRKKDTRDTGLGIIEALINETSGDSSFNPSNKMIVFGPQFKVQIPQTESSSNFVTSSAESPHSPTEFGIKNKDSQPVLHSTPCLNSEAPSSSPGCLSHSEMELLEEYTCVITHGPNPKRTHIFDNCIVENGGNVFIETKKESRSLPDNSPANFISFCHVCKKNLLCKNILMNH